MKIDVNLCFIITDCWLVHSQWLHDHRVNYVCLRSDQWACKNFWNHIHCMTHVYVIKKVKWAEFRISNFCRHLFLLRWFAPWFLSGMQATLREFEDWLEDSVPDAVMISYEKALAKLEECLTSEDTLVSLGLASRSSPHSCLVIHYLQLSLPLTTPSPVLCQVVAVPILPCKQSFL